MSSSPSRQDPLGRREFILNTLVSAGGLALLAMQPAPSRANAFSDEEEYTVQEVIDRILKDGGLTPIEGTVDTIKAGSAEQKVSGIVTTMFPTITVIEEAARRGANFIIAHEPTFYNHRDDAPWMKSNSVADQKKQRLEKHHITIWRFHDYCHALKPDAITYGLVKKAGWLPYFNSGKPSLTLPPISFTQLIQHLKDSLGVAHVRTIGEADQICSRIVVLPGAWGGEMQITTAESEKPDVLIVGEVSEWETAEYIRDGRLLGAKTALIILGHAVSEEPGMEWVVDWLQPKFPKIPIAHVPSGDPFTWL